jgi:hypothetical protein
MNVCDCKPFLNGKNVKHQGFFINILARTQCYDRDTTIAKDTRNQEIFCFIFDEML